jgi:hypothetical protein
MSNILENIGVVGNVQFTLEKSDGTVLQEEVKNLVVNTGTAFIAARMVGTPTAMSHIAIGTGSTTQAAGQTALVTEVARATCTATNTPGTNSVVYQATFNPGVGSGVLRETGIFNANSGGTMLARTVYPILTKEVGDTLTVTWTVTINGV